MQYVSKFEREVEFQQHVLIPMRDGVQLSANIWLPNDANEHPVPALLEYLPYRKSDWTAPRDSQRHPWYAGHGYASIRVDMRGSGDSEGVMDDEYTEQEQQDALDVIEWIAVQPWCTGNVGMFGISWGGFNSLQVAALKPKPLKAIVTVCSTDDRYRNDVHYMGGALLGIDMVAWATTMLAFNARPPLPTSVGDKWLEMWQERLENNSPFLDKWLAHQERDDYWRQGSVCEDYSGIDAAVLAVGGWSDPYRDTVLTLVEHLDAPVKGIIGPWPHQYPDIERGPGPSIGFLQETLRWWDHWLKNKDTGVMDEPDLRAFLMDSREPATWYEVAEGRWVAQQLDWDNLGELEMPLSTWRTAAAASDQELVHVRTPQQTGIDAGRFFPFGNKTDLPPDQREEDGRSVCFDGPVLTEALDILGMPKIRARVCADDNQIIFVRLLDVAPDGSSTLITRGCLNLAKREGMSSVTEIVPGELMDIEFDLVSIGWSVKPGNRLRVAFSSSYFPWIWPIGNTSGFSLDLMNTALVLPRRRSLLEEPRVTFEAPQQAKPIDVQFRASERLGAERKVELDVEQKLWRLTVDPNYGGSRIYPDGLVYDESAREVYEIVSDDPTSARAGSSWRVGLSRPGWQVEIEVDAELRSDASFFYTAHSLRANRDGELVFERCWNQEIPRSSV